MMCVYIHIKYLNAAASNGKRKTEAHVIFFTLFTLCSSCKLKVKIVVCPFVDEETNGIYPLADGLNELNGLAHLWFRILTSFW
jgi:hypothetical protein